MFKTGRSPQTQPAVVFQLPIHPPLSLSTRRRCFAVISSCFGWSSSADFKHLRGADDGGASNASPKNLHEKLLSLLTPAAVCPVAQKQRHIPVVLNAFRAVELHRGGMVCCGRMSRSCARMSQISCAFRIKILKMDKFLIEQ